VSPRRRDEPVRLTRIYTRGGDAGETSLGDGSRVRKLDPLIEASAQLGAGLDWKTSLQELTAATGLGVPEYVVTEDGPDHMKVFTASACVGGITYGEGSGRSKKEAEQQAAEAAWSALRTRLTPPPSPRS